MLKSDLVQTTNIQLKYGKGGKISGVEVAQIIKQTKWKKKKTMSRLQKGF
jgi:hypothetical protein